MCSLKNYVTCFYLLFRINMSNPTSHASESETDKSAPENTQLTKAQKLEKDLKSLRRRARSLSRGSRKRIGKANGISFNDTETSASSASTWDSDNSESSRTNQEKKRKSKKKKKKGYSMSRLLREQQGVMKGVVNKVTDPNDQGDTEMRTLSNSFTSQAINEALKNERALNHFPPPVNGQVAKAPKLEGNSPASVKGFRDAMNSLKDMIPSRITGKEIEGIHEYLTTCSRVATSSNLSLDQFYDLLKSRITQNSTLHREVTNNYKKKTSLKELFRELCTTYTGGSSHLSCLQRFEDFTGAGMSASKFISQLKNLAHDLAHSSHNASDVNEIIYQNVFNKTMRILRPIAPDINERYRMDMRGSLKNDLTTFTGSFMTFSDKVEQLLHHNSKPRSIKVIQEIKATEEKKTQLVKRNRIKREPIPSDSSSSCTEDEEHPSEIQLVNLLKLSRSDLEKLNGLCFKCGSKSPLQKPDHYSRDCLLYSKEPMAMYMCGLCNLGVHLPANCKQSAQGKSALEEKAKLLGIPLTTKTENGQVFAIIQLEKN